MLSELTIALLVGVFAHRQLQLAAIPQILTEAMLATSMAMFIISAATAFGFYLTLERIPARAAELLTLVTAQPLLMLLLINAFLLVVGMSPRASRR